MSLIPKHRGNTVLMLEKESKSKEAYTQGSMIFTSNDIINNSCVILAGVLVLLMAPPFLTWW
ncbi:hypothetical protein [uncultured Pontibacter sp.]|uniref:hypothetical protein n=1 Tax=uncultured Pontibacter sp. TaxID=453356 RepID=UPI002637F709|nr:hypothetical protein [uncultured Pontibacter sp.]